ncbi:MAG TPA: hypothetical protein ENF17_10205 [Candidatus Aminicenantes bacterium]|nr:hypothetical protein [Candidatus Aminicenantes bacterium]
MSPVSNSYSRNLGLKLFLPPFLLGFLSLSIQVIFLREFSAYFQGNELTFGFGLGSWLFWVGIGSLVGPRLRFQIDRFFQGYYLYGGGIVGVFVLLRFSRFIFSLQPGEPASLATIIFASFIYCFFLGFPLGILFVWNANYLNGQVEKTYLREALGSFGGGVLIYFVILPYFSNWQSLALIVLLSCSAIFIIWSSPRKLGFLLSLTAILTTFWLADFPAEKLYWSPFTLKACQDSLYGKLGLIASQEQVTLYTNHSLYFSLPNPEQAEEIIHFPLLQFPTARQMLLIGGGLGGTLDETLKYPFTQVDYVEIDPQLIDLALKFLPEKEKKALHSSRVQLIIADGRAYLNQVNKKYEVIILNLPDPINAQLNRFYTLEFFQMVKQKLTPRGIFAFRITSSENYISKERQLLLSSLYNTLKTVFAWVEVVPGETNIFISSERKLNLTPSFLRSNLEKWAISTKFLTKSYLVSRINPWRQQILIPALQNPSFRLNTDTNPICYFFTALLWGKQFSRQEMTIFSFLAQRGRWWLLDFPLLLLFSGLFLALLVVKNRIYFILFPVICLGFISIVTEIVLLIAYQAQFGSLYHALSLLFSCFMLGLYIGALVSQKLPWSPLPRFLLLLASLIIFLVILGAVIRHPVSPLIYYGAFLLLGYLGGDIFIAATRLYLHAHSHLGLSYGLDLLGSFVGALGVSSLYIPLFGLTKVVQYLIILVSGALLFLFWGSRLSSK